MRMYVILVIAALLLILLGVLTQLVKTARAEKRELRKREETAARLEAVLAQATREYQQRTQAAAASAALTSVIPAIQPDDHAPRKVA